MIGRLISVMIAMVTLLLATPAATAAAADPLLAVFPKGEGRDTKRSYPYQLLRLALEKSGRPFVLRLTELEMPEERARKLIAAGDPSVTVMWSGTSRAFEGMLRPVRIPTSGGLLGHRLFLVNRNDIPRFADVDSVRDLRSFTAGQGANWSDVAILEATGLKVHAAKYHLLLRLLEKRRIDFFPRGANEAFAELERFGKTHPDLAVEPRLVLVYPFASFFFVAKSNDALHDAIHDGLVRAHEDGSFLAFFRSHPATARVLAKARLGERLRIDIDNPLMTEETRAIPERFWFNPSWARKD